MLVLGVVALVVSWARFGWRTGLGFALGGAIGCVNFYWLKRIVEGMGGLAASAGGTVSTRGITFRFLLRYSLMAGAAFVILIVSRESLYGLFAGLLLPVSAMLCEAVYEGYRALFCGM